MRDGEDCIIRRELLAESGRSRLYVNDSLRSQDSDVMTAVNVAQYIEHVGDHIVNWARWWLYFVGEQDSDIIV